MPEQLAGVNQVPAAGETEQQSYNPEEILGLNNTGEEEETAAAGQESQETESQPEEQKFDERIEQAFAKRLAKEREKIRQELEQQYTEQQHVQHQPYQQQDNVVEQLAYQLGITPQAAQILLNQQLVLQNIQDQAAKMAAKVEIEKERQSKPYLPEFSEEKLSKIRDDYQKRYGMTLPWGEAYRMYVAEYAFSGNLSTAAEQQAIAKITGRDKATVQAGKGTQVKPPDIWDLPKEDFEKMLNDAKAGKFTKS